MPIRPSWSGPTQVDAQVSRPALQVNFHVPMLCQTKDRCDVSSCGTGCRLCPLALEVPGNAKASRPVPIRAFRLAILGRTCSL
eukprot:s4284_g2.t1